MPERRTRKRWLRDQLAALKKDGVIYFSVEDYTPFIQGYLQAWMDLNPNRYDLKLYDDMVAIERRG